MKLEEIGEIKQTSEEGEVNKYLVEGYKLIKIISGKVLIGNHELTQPIYILARVENAS